MKHTGESIKHWQPQIQALWPALKGSLVKVRKPCIGIFFPGEPVLVLLVALDQLADPLTFPGVVNKGNSG
jgi:hypothetical protein